jgi:uncharacterized membrane protein YphA (DoxX/SURF4 family)
MQDSAVPSDASIAGLELSPVKNILGWLAALTLSLLFLSSGIWKIIDPTGWAVRVAQAKIPAALSLPAAILVGISETLAGVLILVPRFRRWGACLAGGLLVLFLAYFAMNYQTLAGQDCSCFPWLKRVVGPGFFVGDAAMLALAVIAGLWAKPAAGLRTAALMLAAVAVFALISYGVDVTRQTGVEAPDTITVDGKPFNTHLGKVFIYFLNPECMHCFNAAKAMSKLNWGDTKVIAVATEQPQFTGQFLQDTGLKAGTSKDLEVLKKTFPFVNAPAGVALVNGREKAMLTEFEGKEPEGTLKKLEFIY